MAVEWKYFKRGGYSGIREASYKDQSTENTSDSPCRISSFHNLIS